jgi:hypothetical protein
MRVRYLYDIAIKFGAGGAPTDPNGTDSIRKVRAHTKILQNHLFGQVDQLAIKALGDVPHDTG